ncbi:glycoside hydrolase family 9 protein [Lyngbya aestuarii]|uniref:glycoside hydrolase family 9 protein n=1 Tax=Lyngbya aestuarii TaxID=118322 RepID=UPI00403D8851
MTYGLYAKGNAQSLLRPSSSKIVINQVGYCPGRTKAAFLINLDNPTSNQVKILDAKTRKTVFVTQLGQPLKDSASQDLIQTVDFTDFNQEGSYYLKLGNLESSVFPIGRKIYQDAFTKLLRSYYLQRCGVAINDPVTGINHPPCHLSDGIIAHQDNFHQAGESLSATGGWHDAGDFGKYVGPTAVTVGRLLSLYEQYPSLFSDRQLTIPESGNGRPDLLDEVKVGLDWMLKMQRRDGAVYRKLSGKNWPGEIMPNEDTQPRLVYGISTPETGKFAGAMAMAARVYAPIDSGLAQNYLQAARKAWDFLQRQPSMKVDWFEGDDSGSGKYLASEWDPEESLKTDQDDRLWAAAELLITTGEDTFEQYLSENLPTFDYTLFEWKDPSPLAMSNYLMRTGGKGSEDLKQQIKQKLIGRADALLQKVNRSGYRLAIDKFVWASNKMVAEEGITLFYAYQLTGNKDYLRAASDQVDYLLGRNHFNLSFVSSVGTNAVQHVHHRIARAKRVVIPGLLVGGPNTDAQDDIAPKSLGPLSYVDDERSYATNEYAIDYNASLIGLMGMLIGEA